MESSLLELLDSVAGGGLPITSGRMGGKKLASAWHSFMSVLDNELLH